ncbi:TMEM175 family protein [Natrinema caseinilyticum]|uniref:TMEM175 family protein n=1 Tax=Natrinema caseinilyticum TaxID=2961570 RepID=UPI0020C261E5|nr:TMEM175 family protein [Natrinema caseinilyticum]
MNSPAGREIDETDRLVALSDGVIAIAITLLVLEISVPTVPAGSSLSFLPELVAEQWHEFVGYALSFLVVGLYWILHRRVFVHVERHDRGVLWLNLFFLLLVAFVPYGTNLFINYPNQFGITFYAGVLALTGLCLALLWGYVSREDLLEEGLTSRTVLIQEARFLASPLVFILSMGVAVVDPSLAILTWTLLIPINAVLQSRLLESLERSA